MANQGNGQGQGNQPVVVNVQLQPPPNSDLLRGQLFEAGSMFFVAVLVVYLAKQLINLFSINES